MKQRQSEIMDHGFGDAFPLNLGTIDSAYRLVYQTTITDDLGQTYKNNVTLSGSNQEPISACCNGNCQTRPTTGKSDDSLQRPDSEDYMASQVQLR